MCSTQQQQGVQTCPSRHDGADRKLAVLVLTTAALILSACAPPVALAAVVCYTDYMTMASCNAQSAAATVAPFCRWCPGTGTCVQNTTACYSSCASTAPATDGTICSASSSCTWCASLGVCFANSGAGSGTCYASCNAASLESSEFCNNAHLCKWCSTVGYCELKTDTCYTSCQAATANSTACALSTSCQWCSQIGICRLTSDTCYPTCVAATTAGEQVCGNATTCQWCSGISVCQPTSISCYATCAAAAANSTVCDASTTCKWCSAIQSCQAESVACYSWCPAATVQGSSFCDATLQCTWCAAIGVCQRTNASLPCYSTCVAATANVTSCSYSTTCTWCPAIGACRANDLTCYATCPAASVEGSTLCSTTTQCKWCATTASIGVCQASSGTCWDTCLAASNDAAASSLCASSTACQWCPLKYCAATNATCHTSCDTIAADNSAICQVTPIQANCNWCAAVFSCYAPSSGFVCPGSCESFIWKQSACESFSGCHWCPQHGGRCKPVEGKTQGYIGWRREAACDTGSYSSSYSPTNPLTATTTYSYSGTFSPEMTMSASPNHTASPTAHASETESKTPIPSLSMSSTITSSRLPSESFSVSTSSVPTLTASPNATSSATPSTTSTLSGTESTSISATMTVSLEKTISQPRTPTRSTTVSAVSASNGQTLSVSESITKTASLSRTESASASESISSSSSRSSTVSSSSSQTESESPTISIDPCNTTFRDDSTDFIRRVSLQNGVQYGTLNSSDSTFLVINRVQLAAMRTLQVQIGFNTYLRNFYYNTSFDWFPLPTISNCIASGFQLVNATDFIVRIDYNPEVSLSVGVNDDYFCNLTFSTDIFQCQLMTNFTFNFSATILVTGTPQIMSATAAAAIGASSAFLSLLSSGAALIQQARAEGLAELASCQFSLVDSVPFDQTPLQLGFGSRLQYYNRGCVVGNVALLAIIAIAAAVLIGAVALVFRGEVAVYSGNVQARLQRDAESEEGSHDNLARAVNREDEYVVPLQQLLSAHLDGIATSSMTVAEEVPLYVPPSLDSEGGIAAPDRRIVERNAQPSSKSMSIRSNVDMDAHHRHVEPIITAEDFATLGASVAQQQQRAVDATTHDGSDKPTISEAEASSAAPQLPQNDHSSPPLVDIIAVQHSSNVISNTSNVHDNSVGGGSSSQRHHTPLIHAAATSSPPIMSSSQHNASHHNNESFRDAASNEASQHVKLSPPPVLVSSPPSPPQQQQSTPQMVHAAAHPVVPTTSPFAPDNTGVVVRLHTVDNNAALEKHNHSALTKEFLTSRKETFLEAYARYSVRVGFPSVLSVPACLLFDSTITFSVRLLVHPIDENDTLIGIVGLVVFGGLLLVCVVYTSRVARKPAPMKVNLTHPLVGAPRWRWLRYIFLPITDFSPKKRRDRRHQEMMSFILEDSRIPQYFCCDLALSALIASLGGVGISKREVCARLAAAALAGNALFFIMVLWLRPCITRYSLGLTAFAAFLGLMSASFTFVSMETGALILGTLNQYTELLMLLTTAMGIVAIVIAVVAFYREKRRTMLASKLKHRHGDDKHANDLDEELVEVTPATSVDQDCDDAAASGRRRSHPSDDKKTRRWVRRIVVDTVTGEEVDTSTSSSGSDSDNGEETVYTIVDSEGNTTSDRQKQERRRIAALEAATAREQKERHEIKELEASEAFPRDQLIASEASELDMLLEARTADATRIMGSAEAYATWRNMLERQRTADGPDDGAAATVDRQRGTSYLSMLLMQEDGEEVDDDRPDALADVVTTHGPAEAAPQDDQVGPPQEQPTNPGEGPASTLPPNNDGRETSQQNEETPDNQGRSLEEPFARDNKPSDPQDPTAADVRPNDLTNADDGDGSSALRML